MVHRTNESADRYLFRVYMPDAAEVQLVGSFSGWKTGMNQMSREDTGWWTITVPLAPGDHDFCYLVNDSTWVADYAASGVKRNSFGGWVSQIHVPAPDTALQPVVRAVSPASPAVAA